jgi:hypothetical protein
MPEQVLADPFQIPVGIAGIAGLPAVNADYCSAMPFAQPPGSAGAKAAGVPHAHQRAVRRAAIGIATRDMVACGSAVPAATRVTVVSVCLLLAQASRQCVAGKCCICRGHRPCTCPLGRGLSPLLSQLSAMHRHSCHTLCATSHPSTASVEMAPGQWSAVNLLATTCAAHNRVFPAHCSSTTVCDSSMLLRAG